MSFSCVFWWAHLLFSSEFCVSCFGCCINQLIIMGCAYFLFRDCCFDPFWGTPSSTFFKWCRFHVLSDEPTCYFLYFFCFFLWLLHKSIIHHGLCFFYYSEIAVLIHSQDYPIHRSSSDVLFMCFFMNPFIIHSKILCFLLWWLHKAFHHHGVVFIYLLILRLLFWSILRNTQFMFLQVMCFSCVFSWTHLLFTPKFCVSCFA